MVERRTRGGSATAIAAVAAELLAYAGSKGADLGSLRRRYKLAPDLESDAESHIPAALLLRMWSELPRELADPNLGLHVAERFARPHANLATLLISSGRSVGAGIEAYMAHQAAFNQFHPTRWRRDARGGELSIDGRSHLRIPRPAVEFALAWWALTIQRSTGLTQVAESVDFAYPYPGSTAAHERVFSVTPRFSRPANRLLIADATLRRAPRTASPQLATVGAQVAGDLALRHAHEVPPALRVQAWIEQRLRHGGDVSLEVAAASLGVSARTLQRHLRDAGRTFSALHDRMRLTIAVELVEEGGLSMDAIAERIGFSDPAGFFRAFRRWTGMTPAAFRGAQGSARHSASKSDTGTASTSKGSSGS